MLATNRGLVLTQVSFSTEPLERAMWACQITHQATREEPGGGWGQGGVNDVTDLTVTSS